MKLSSQIYFGVKQCGLGAMAKMDLVDIEAASPSPAPYSPPAQPRAGMNDMQRVVRKAFIAVATIAAVFAIIVVVLSAAPSQGAISCELP